MVQPLTEVPSIPTTFIAVRNHSSNALATRSHVSAFYRLYMELMGPTHRPLGLAARPRAFIHDLCKIERENSRLVQWVVYSTV
jgi:hypothetical protein